MYMRPSDDPSPSKPRVGRGAPMEGPRDRRGDPHSTSRGRRSVRRRNHISHPFVVHFWHLACSALQVFCVFDIRTQPM